MRFTGSNVVALVAVVLLFILGVFGLYMERYHYSTMHDLPTRTDRLTGKVEVYMFKDGWQEIGQPSPKPSE